MPRLWPRMPYEAPPDYVSFVERHLDWLRRDAASVVGDDGVADQLYPEVLTDVAARWSWLELMRRRLGRAGAADTYLRHAFERRSTRWRSGEWSAAGRQAPDDVEEARADIYVWRTDGEQWRPNVTIGRTDIAFEPTEAWRLDNGSPPPPTPSSAAVRLAPHLVPAHPVVAAPVAEAAVAWWHAYEAWRRRRFIAGCVVVFLVLAIAGRTAPDDLGLGVPHRTDAVDAPDHALGVPGQLDVRDGWTGVPEGWAGVPEGWAGVPEGWAGVPEGWAGVREDSGTGPGG